MPNAGLDFNPQPRREGGKVYGGGLIYLDKLPVQPLAVAATISRMPLTMHFLIIPAVSKQSAVTAHHAPHVQQTNP